MKIIITNENFTNGAQSRLEMAEKSISECKDRLEYSIWRTEKKKHKETWSVRKMWDTTKYTNICLMGVPKKEKREKGGEKNIWRNSRKISKFIERY